MAAPARTLLFDLPQGFQFQDTSFTLTAADLSRYLDAVEDGNEVYAQLRYAPPLAVAARALGTLLEVAELPAGTLHTGQEVESHRGCPIGAPLTFSGRIAQRSERAGLVISVIEFTVATEDGQPAVSGRTTVMAPAGVVAGDAS
jgi:hypothetical protein